MERDFKGVWIQKEIWLNEELGWTEKLLLVEIGSLANNGECFATNDYFAKFFKLSKRQISRLISSLAEKGFISVELLKKEGSNEIEKRILHPIDKTVKSPTTETSIPHDINVHTPIDKSDYTPHDISVVDNNTKTFSNTVLNNTNNKTSNKSKKNMLENEFELLWKSYPRKQGKAKAYKSYIKARENDSVSYERVQNGIDNYIRYIEIHRVGEEYVKHGSTWFGNECWEEEYNLKRDSIKGERSGFLGLYLNELDNRADILEYQGGGQYDERGNYEVISDNPLFFSEPLQKF